MSETQGAGQTTPGPEEPEADPPVTAAIKQARAELSAIGAKLRKIVNRIRGATDAQEPAPVEAHEAQASSLMQATEELKKSIEDMKMLVEEVGKFV